MLQLLGQKQHRPHFSPRLEYEVLGKVIQGVGAVDALNSAAVAPPPAQRESEPIIGALEGPPSDAPTAPTVPAVNILVRGCNLVFKQKVSSNSPSTVPFLTVA